MSDLTDNTMTIETMRELLRTVMADVVTSNQVRPLVEAAVDRAVDFRIDTVNARVSAIDAAQRDAYRNFENTAEQFRKALQSFTDLAHSLTTETRVMQQRQETDGKRISDLFRRVDEVETRQGEQAGETNKRLTSIEQRVGDLHDDIHGNKENTNHPSVFALLNDLKSDVKAIASAQSEAASYINKRRSIESAIFNLGTKAVGSSSLKFVLKWGLVFGTGGGALTLIARALVFISTGQ